jgi:hypothetical protein
MAIEDGRLKTALAIDNTSDLVTVSLGPPITVVPTNLFVRRFNDPKVGIDDQQMQDFKDRLKIYLPKIASDIDKIPENANLIIEDVAEYVRLALLKQEASSAFVEHVAARNLK